MKAAHSLLLSSALTLVLSAAACSASVHTDIQATTDETATGQTAHSPCPPADHNTMAQATPETEATPDRLSDVLPELASTPALKALADSYSLCGIPVADVSDLLGQGELGRQYRQLVLAVGSHSYSNFVEAYKQQPCFTAYEFGQPIATRHRLDAHIAATNTAANMRFNPTDKELADIATQAVADLFGADANQLLFQTQLAISITDGTATCEQFMRNVEVVSDSSANQPAVASEGE